MKSISALFICCQLVLTSIAQVSPQSLDWQGGIVGISIVDVSNGEQQLEYNATSNLALASATKVFTTALIYENQLSNQRFKTSIGYTGSITSGALQGDLVISCSGDPTLGGRLGPEPYAMHSAIVKALRDKGIREIHGDIVFENNSHSGVTIPRQWIWEDIANYYGAVAKPFNYRENTYLLHLASSSSGDTVKVLETEPALQGVAFSSQCVAANIRSDKAYIFFEPGSQVRTVHGKIPANRSKFTIKGSIQNPDQVFAEELKLEFMRHYINFFGNVRATSTVSNKTSLVTWESESMHEIATLTNQVSHNLYAEALGRYTAQHLSTKTDYDAQVAWLNAALIKHFQLLKEQVNLHDFCGLSRGNIMSANNATRLLLAMNASDHSKSFQSSLSISGENGTLAYFFKDPEYKGKVIGKTGSMQGVQSLMGYIRSASGKTFAFCILVNNFTGNRSTIRNNISLLLKPYLSK